jgi:hypothetical protein
VRKKIFPIIAVLVLIAAGFYAWWASHTGPAAQAAAIGPRQAPAEPTSTFVPKLISKGRPQIYTGPKFDPVKKYPPGTYTPAGFAVDYRERVVREFGHFMSTRLGKELDEERMKQVAVVQNKFWDEHGPNVDLLAEDKITQKEFSDRVHKTSIAFDAEMEKIFSDEEYEKIFDIPKGTDTFYVLAHSKDEQPGMKFQPEPSHPNPNAGLAQPGPGATENLDPPPATTTDKFPKSAAPPK